jgi:Holliday junction resolvase RusA-like endonuclease
MTTPTAEHGGRTLRFTIPGNAVGKGRARATVRRGKGGKIITDAKGNPVIGNYTPEATRTFESLVKDIAGQKMHALPIITRPIELQITVYVAIPGGWPVWKQEAAARQEIGATTKPDLDNVEKAIKDALNGVVWVDDVQVISCDKVKLYVDDGRPARIEVAIREDWRCSSRITRREQLVLLR